MPLGPKPKVRAKTSRVFINQKNVQGFLGQAISKVPEAHVKQKAEFFGARPTKTGFSFATRDNLHKFIDWLKGLKAKAEKASLEESAKYLREAYKAAGKTEKEIEWAVKTIIYNKWD